MVSFTHTNLWSNCPRGIVGGIRTKKNMWSEKKNLWSCFFKLSILIPTKTNTWEVVTLPGEGTSLFAPVGLVLLAGPSPSAAPPSVPGALRISLEVSEDIPVTAQPAQLDEAPAGWAQDATSFSAGRTVKRIQAFSLSASSLRSWEQVRQFNGARYVNT